MDEHAFEGLRIVITGAGSGIGRATTQRLAANGAHLSAGDVDESGLAATVEAIPEAARARVRTQRCDVADETSVAEFVERSAEHLGGIDALVNLAGVLSFSNSHEVDLEDWNRIISINLTGTFLMCRAALPHLIESRGTIVNTASTAAHAGQAWAAAYCASKGAVLSMSRALAVEYGGRGVRVNTVSPGAIETPIMNAFAFPEGADTSLLLRTMPIGPAGAPEDAAAAIAMLVSREAHYINGADLRVDGATTA